MPEQEKETKVGQPAFDPNKLLRQLETLVKSKSKSVDVAHGNPARTGKSWVWSIILPIIVLAGIAVFAWISRRGNRELAKLRHEKNKTEIYKKNAIVHAKVSQNDQSIEDARKLYNLAQERLRIIEADIAAEEKRHETDMHALHRIRTWDGSYRRLGG